jgi:hypothetical protein
LRKAGLPTKKIFAWLVGIATSTRQPSFRRGCADWQARKALSSKSAKLGRAFWLEQSPDCGDRQTACGRATIYALKMNDELQTTAHKIWKLTGLFPPEDD